MRLVAWAFLVCTVLGAAGLFLPSFGLRVGGVSLGRRASLSVYQAIEERDLVRRVAVAYRQGARTPVGSAMVAALSSASPGRLSHFTADVRSAAMALDVASGEDAAVSASLVSAALWVVLALHAIMAFLVVGGAIEGNFRRWRLIVTVLVAMIVAAVGIGLFVVARSAVDDVNAELGRGVLELGVGCYVIAGAAVGALALGIGLVVMHTRTQHAGRM